MSEHTPVFHGRMYGVHGSVGWKCMRGYVCMYVCVCVCMHVWEQPNTVHGK